MNLQNITSDNFPLFIVAAFIIGIVPVVLAYLYAKKKGTLENESGFFEAEQTFFPFGVATSDEKISMNITWPMIRVSLYQDFFIIKSFMIQEKVFYKDCTKVVGKNTHNGSLGWQEFEFTKNSFIKESDKKGLLRINHTKTVDAISARVRSGVAR